jgi:hypothetical protein
MQLPGCPRVVKKCLEIVEGTLRPACQGTLTLDIMTMAGVDNPLPDMGKKQTLDDDIHRAINALLISEGSQPTSTTEAINYPKVKIGGLSYSNSQSTPADSYIFFRHRQEADPVPAAIREILLFPADAPPDLQHVFLLIQKYRPYPLSESPFATHPGSRLGLWSSAMVDTINVIRPSQDICHAIQRKWGESVLVMRQTYRVAPSCAL